MITRIEIDNFKSLQKFDMDVAPVTVIVGNNASGKSTVLQALDFFSSSVKEDFGVLLGKRGWNVANIKSKLAQNPDVRFYCELELDIENKTRKLSWEIVLHLLVTKNIVELKQEEITDLETGAVWVKYKNGRGSVTWYDGANEVAGQFQYPNLSLNSSFMKIISVDKKENFELKGIQTIKDYFMNSESFELLSPDEMRTSSRGTVDSIGMSGKNLPSYIKGMSVEQKKNFMKKASLLFHGKIVEINAKTKGKPGWTQLEITEQYENRQIIVTSREISDGTLRLLAFLAITETDKNAGMVLLDEIENGINSANAESVMTVLKTLSQEKKRQLILTTHSTVFLDYVDRESIVFLYRDEKTGQTKAVSLFEVPEINEMLKYMYPGEVLLNMTNEELIEMCMLKNGE